MTEPDLWATAERVMTANQWLVYYLRYKEDMPVVKIAQALQISRQAVDGRLEDGRRRLVKAITEQEAA